LDLAIWLSVTPDTLILSSICDDYLARLVSEGFFKSGEMAAPLMDEEVSAISGLNGFISLVGMLLTSGLAVTAPPNSPPDLVFSSSRELLIVCCATAILVDDVPSFSISCSDAGITLRILVKISDANFVASNFLGF